MTEPEQTEPQETQMEMIQRLAEEHVQSLARCHKEIARARKQIKNGTWEGHSFTKESGAKRTTFDWAGYNKMWDNIKPTGWFASPQASIASIRQIVSRQAHPGSSDSESPSNARLLYELIQAGLPKLDRGEGAPSPFYQKHTIPSIERAAVNFAKPWEGFHGYQNDGISLLVAAERGQDGPVRGKILADDMGLGKTLQIIALMEECPMREGEPTLIVCDAIVLQNWHKEFKHWVSPCPKMAATGSWLGPEVDVVDTIEDFKKYDIIFTNYQTVAAQFTKLEVYCEDMMHSRRYPFPARRARQIGTKAKPKLRTLDFNRPEGCAVINMDWGRVVLDESHRINNSKSNISKGCRSLKSRYRLLVSGTPQQNNYSDIMSQCQFLGMKPFDDEAWFKSHFLTKSTGDHQDHGILQDPVRQDSDAAKLRAHETPQLEAKRNVILYLAILPHIIRRTADGTTLGKPNLELPRLKVEDIMIDLDDGSLYHNWMKDEAQNSGVNIGVDLLSMRRFIDLVKTSGTEEIASPFLGCDQGTIDMMHQHYQEFLPSSEQETQFESRQQWCEPWRDAIFAFHEKIPSHGRRNELKISQRALLRCFHPAAILPRPQLAKFLNKNEDHWKSSKSVHVTNLIEACLVGVDGKAPLAPNDKWVVVSSSSRVLDIMAFALNQRGIESLRLDGKTPNERRKMICSQFTKTAGSPSVLLMITKLGVGIDLTGANKMAILSPDWNPEVDNRVMKRLHRIGQTKPVVVYRYWARNSMDLRVLALQIAKKNKSFGIMDLFVRPLSELSPTQQQLRMECVIVLESMPSWSEERFVRELQGLITDMEAEDLMVLDDDNDDGDTEEDDH